MHKGMPRGTGESFPYGIRLGFQETDVIRRSTSRRRRILSFVTAITAVLLPVNPAQSKDFNQVARGITVPAGFAATVFAQAPIVATTLTWGPAPEEAATADAALHHGTLLYVGGVAGNPLSCKGCGQVIAYGDEPGPPAMIADGLNSVLGIAFGPDETLYVSDNFDNTGRVLALNDTDGDGAYETQRILLKNIPNGRHQTNGLSIGPDGMLYVANGNATDDGLECGPPLGPAPPTTLPPPLGDIYDGTFRDKSCATREVAPWTGSILRIDTAWNNVDLQKDVRVDADAFYAEDGLDDESVLVARGFRNIYDVDFRPGAPNEIWTPMNGPDDPAGSEPIYGLSIDNEEAVGTDQATGEPIFGPVIEDAGFPSCLFDPHANPFPSPSLSAHEHPGSPEPEDNPDPAIRAAYGPCPKDEILRPRAVLKEGHEGVSGLAFERGANFPARYDGDLFIAEWGSLWNLNGGRPTGHKVIRLDVGPDGEVTGRQTEFMTSALPMDITFGPDGMMYVADMTGTIFQIRHVSDAATPDVVTINMSNGQFVPQVLTIVRGQTVRWVNSDTVPHNIRAIQAVKLVDPTLGEPAQQPGNEIDSPGDIPPGGSYSFTFGDRAGVWHYHSTSLAEENSMRGTIIVLPVER